MNDDFTFVHRYLVFSDKIKGNRGNTTQCLSDIELLALSLELGAVIVSDDYSIQNLASRMGIAFEPFGKAPIREEFKWTYRCKGCGKFYDEPQPDCPVCGSEVVQKRKR